MTSGSACLASVARWPAMRLQPAALDGKINQAIGHGLSRHAVGERLFEFGQSPRTPSPALAGTLHGDEENGAGGQKTDAEGRRTKTRLSSAAQHQPDQQHDADAAEERRRDRESASVAARRSVSSPLPASSDTRPRCCQQRRRGIAQGGEEAVCLPRPGFGPWRRALATADESRPSVSPTAAAMPTARWGSPARSRRWRGPPSGRAEQRRFRIPQADLASRRRSWMRSRSSPIFLARLTGGGAQDFLGVGDDELHVGNEFFLGGVCDIDIVSHDGSFFQYAGLKTGL